MYVGGYGGVYVGGYMGDVYIWGYRMCMYGGIQWNLFIKDISLTALMRTPL